MPRNNRDLPSSYAYCYLNVGKFQREQNNKDIT